MKRTRMHPIGALLAIVGLAAAIAALAATIRAQNPGPRIPMASDWSHQHVIFSGSISADKAGRIQREPRYWMQLFGRNARKLVAGNSEEERGEEDFSEREQPRRRRQERTFDRDWGQSLGAG